MKIPFRMIRHQGTMLKTLGGILLSSIFPIRPKTNPAHIDDVHVVLPAPNEELVSQYQRWCTFGIETSTQQRFLADPHQLPAHLFSQFALSICAQQLKQLRYPLLGIINQGVGLEVIHPIPLGEPLHITCKMIEVSEEEGKARIHQQLIIGTANIPHCYTASFHTVFILGRSKKPKTSKEPEVIDFEKIGQWTVAPNDGWNFALLTGDFNPIHWIGFIAKFSPFKQKVLHGFGMFTRSIETVQQHFQTPIKSIHVRFVSPAKLNNQKVSVLVSDESSDESSNKKEGIRQIELRDASNKLLMAGDISL